MKKRVDFILHHAKIYTVDQNFSQCEAMAISNGKIRATGSNISILDQYEAPKMHDAKGYPVYPGFIDAHAHFYFYGQSLQATELKDTKSWQEVLEKVHIFSKKNNIEWIQGRGWDQNLWDTPRLPDNQKLNQLFPDKPVFLIRVDEHAAIANQKALDIAGIKAETIVEGGEVQLKNGKPTGILLDNAINLIKEKIPVPTLSEKQKCLLDAQENCFAVGLTTIDDCGLDREMIEFIAYLQKEGILKMRLNIMISDKQENYDYYLQKGPYKTDFLNINSFKLFSDGALGSRGACMLKDYVDRPGWNGFFLNEPSHFEETALRLANSEFQMCTHAIGDAANRMVLQAYAKALKGQKNRHWRIEHAQFVHKDDLHFFRDYQIIPSVQPTHATTDMHWAEERLGKERTSGIKHSKTYAYAYKTLLQQNGWLPLGTDFPVEDINPMTTFYAAVTRQDKKGYPQNGFLPEEALSREEALRGMTIWPARLNFEEEEKGSLEPGKFADFVIMNKDIMEVEIKDTLKAQVKATFLGGDRVF